MKLLKTPTAMHRRPMLFGTLRWKPQQEMAATFLVTLLDLRGRNCGLFIHLGQQGEEGKPGKQAGRTSLTRFWLGIVHRLQFVSLFFNKYKKYRKITNTEKKRKTKERKRDAKRHGKERKTKRGC